MAEREELIIEISAETSSLVRSLSDGADGLEQFGITGKETAKNLEIAYEKLLKTTTETFSVDQMKAYNAAMQEVSDSIKKLKDAAESGEKVNDENNKLEVSARKARVAVYGLNQVVRDAPFGFIAISNNIPILLDQFQSLRAETGSTKKAFAAFADGLRGAGGVSIGISIVISSLVSLVQEYGSLSNALNEIFGLVTSLARAKEQLGAETSKSIAGTVDETQRLSTLTKILNDSNASQTERKNAYTLLKKEFPGVIQGLSQENALTAQGGKIIDARSKQLIEYIKLKGRQAALVKLIEQESLKQLEAQRKLTVELTGENQTWLNSIENAIKAAVFNDPIYQIKSLTKEFKNATQNIDFFGKSLESLTISELNFDTLLTGVETLDKAKKKSDTEQKKAANELLNSQIKALQARIEAQKAALLNIKILDENYLTEVTKLLRLEADLKIIKASEEIKNAKDKATALASIEAELSERIRKETNDRAKANYEYWENYRKSVAQANAEFIDYADTTVEQYDKIDFGGVSARIQAGFKSIGDATKRETENLKVFIDLIENALSNAVNDFFTAIENGDNAFAALGKSLKQFLIDLGKTVAKALIFAAILALIPGGGLAAGAVGSVAKGTGNFTNIFKGLLGLSGQASGGSLGGVAAPVGAGGLNLAGQVVFVQRGSDLVGVLNNTNSRIGRLG